MKTLSKAPRKCPICGEKLRLADIIFFRIAKQRGMAIHLTRQDPKEDVAFCILDKDRKGRFTTVWMTDEEALSGGIAMVHAAYLAKRLD